ncbi:hypothetical protein BV25DRAFT_1867968 [Artomyces pyxidatus]|uniref:Uncharacterized protein n=1 Tax=Artomyces pyxidatus TaxID=48021 RepID=A0ACB8TEE5_9AGAM|nr:hypothetical protein BV25DRAFT_1867968 [Artomyces pyxidatus]
MTRGQPAKSALRLLVQHVTRAFYDPRFIAVMDQMARHQVLKDDDLAGRMGLQVKELNKLMAVLEKDRLVQVHRQNELKEGAQRSVGRQYFFVDFQHFCNVVKWRVAEMRRIIDSGLRNELESKGYVCPQCGANYSPLEVNKLVDFERGDFICEVCQGVLIENENADKVRGNQDRMQRFNYQMRHIFEGLRKSEAMVMPAFDIVQSIRTLTSEAAAQKAAGEPGRGLKVAGESGVSREDEGVGIVLSTDKDDETIRRERDEEAAAKRQQNAMPAWHLKSTITGDLTALGLKETARTATNGDVNGTSSLDDSLKGLGRVGSSMTLSVQESVDSSTTVDVKPDLRETHSMDYYDQYYASLAASAAPSTTHTPSGDFSLGADDFEEDRKPNIEYLDSLNEFNKRSRSREDDRDVGSKLARTEMQWSQETAVTFAIDDEPRLAADGIGAAEDPVVYVNGKPMPFSHVTEEDQELMTPEEYTAYFEVYQARS